MGLLILRSSAPAQGGGGEEEIDAAEDWASRSGGAGVFFAKNFDYADLDELSDDPFFWGAAPPGPDPAIFELTDEHALSGRCLRINMPPESGEDSRTLIFKFDEVAGTAHDDFYVQVVLWGDRHFDWPWRGDGEAA